MKKNDRFVRTPEVLQRTGMSNPTLWRWERDGLFPKRVSLGKNSCGWIESELDAWFESKAAGREVNASHSEV